MQKLIALVALTLTALASPAVAGCLEFEGPPAGATFGVGFVHATPAVTATLRPFQWSTGVFTAAGAMNIVASNNANGSPVQEANLNNINLSVNPTAAVGSVSFLYADFGGNVNLAINGVLRNAGDMQAFNGMVFGGATVSAPAPVAFFGGHYGVVTINANPGNVVNAFALGGQEFFTDSVCW